jgi:hypothetical protein
MRAPAERIGLAVHVHVRRHAGRRACQCDARGENMKGYFSQSNILVRQRDDTDDGED